MGNVVELLARACVCVCASVCVDVHVRAVIREYCCHQWMYSTWYVIINNTHHRLVFFCIKYDAINWLVAGAYCLERMEYCRVLPIEKSRNRSSRLKIAKNGFASFSSTCQPISVVLVIQFNGLRTNNVSISLKQFTIENVFTRQVSICYVR